MTATYIVQAFAGGRWARLRGPEGMPFLRREHAARIATARAAARRDGRDEMLGCPHRVVELGGGQ